MYLSISYRLKAQIIEFQEQTASADRTVFYFLKQLSPKLCLGSISIASLSGTVILTFPDFTTKKQSEFSPSLKMTAPLGNLSSRAKKDIRCFQLSFKQEKALIFLISLQASFCIFLLSSRLTLKKSSLFNASSFVFIMALAVADRFALLAKPRSPKQWPLSINLLPRLSPKSEMQISPSTTIQKQSESSFLLNIVWFDSATSFSSRSMISLPAKLLVLQKRGWLMRTPSIISRSSSLMVKSSLMSWLRLSRGRESMLCSRSLCYLRQMKGLNRSLGSWKVVSEAILESSQPILLSNSLSSFHQQSY